MLTLASSNPAKYAPFGGVLERLRLSLQPPPQPLPEIQTLSFHESLEAKARAAATLFGRPVLVDDAGLVLEALAALPRSAHLTGPPRSRPCRAKATPERCLGPRRDGMPPWLLAA